MAHGGVLQCGKRTRANALRFQHPVLGRRNSINLLKSRDAVLQEGRGLDLPLISATPYDPVGSTTGSCESGDQPALETLHMEQQAELKGILWENSKEWQLSFKHLTIYGISTSMDLVIIREMQVR